MTTKFFAPPTFRIHINQNAIHPSSHDKNWQKNPFEIFVHFKNMLYLCCAAEQNNTNDEPQRQHITKHVNFTDA